MRAYFVHCCDQERVQERDVHTTTVQCTAKRCFVIQRSHFTLHAAFFISHTSHLFRTSSQLISSELFSPNLTSSQLFSSLLISSRLITSQMSSKFFSTTFISSEHSSTLLISSKLCLTHLRSSVHQKACTVRQKLFYTNTLYCIPCKEKLVHADTSTNIIIALMTIVYFM